MSNLSVFDFQGHEIRGVDGKPVANDVAAALGYKDPAKTISTKVKAKNKGVTILVTPGGTPRYLKSKDPNALPTLCGILGLPEGAE